MARTLSRQSVFSDEEVREMPAVGGVRRKGASVSMMEVQHPESDRMYASSSEAPFWKVAIAGIIIIVAIILIGMLFAGIMA
jgi:hypothetical protein